MESLDVSRLASTSRDSGRVLRVYVKLLIRREYLKAYWAWKEIDLLPPGHEMYLLNFKKW